MFLLRVKTIVDYIAIVGVFYILLYQIKKLRNFCKAICEYLIKWFIPVGLSSIKTIYFGIEKWFRIAIVLSVIGVILSLIIRIINEKRMKKETGEGRFEKSLFRYLHDNTVPRCFLITGQWGSGKSFEVKQFFDKYYCYAKTQVYRVSCFGLNSRKELIDEINHIIEESDKSFYAQIIKVLQYLPVIGEALNKFLKKTYGYNSIHKGSVFIFEDFERITSRPITNSNFGKSLYEESHSFRRWRIRGGEQYTEFEAIKDEFEEVGKAFSRIEDFENTNSLRDDYDKYIAIIGFINELIEVYGLKVIIVCNTDILGEKFTHDVLRSKLNCLEYKKVITSETKVSIMESILESRIFDDDEKQKRIKQYCDTIKEEIEGIELDIRFKDMRLFGGLIEAFLDTAVLFDKEMLTMGFLNSLLNSIMIMHLAYYNNSIKKINAYINGANLEFLILLFGGTIDTTNLIRLNGYNENLKWVDERISGYWILNLSIVNDIKRIGDEWKNYQYSELERQVFLAPNCLMEATDYNLMHVFFYQTRISEQISQEWECRPYLESALSGYDLGKIEVVQGILDNMYQICNGRIYRKFQDTLFEILSRGKASGKVKGNTYFHNDYNDFLEKRNQ
ncbi:MAG: hypothetical protein IJE43_03730 [Alphaproteobacteria bacterium]|nr:hypothetical protein [Alphaproteobacteria bacterium]